MLTKLRFLWQEMESSFWFVPAAIVLGSVGLAISLIFIDATVELHFDKHRANQSRDGTTHACCRTEPNAG